MKPLLESKDVTVLIVNYRGADDTINCLRSLYELVEAPGRIIVIDNNSNDGSVDKIFFFWLEFASPTIIRNDDIETTNLKSSSIILIMPENGGYAYGNNAGIRLAFRDSGCKAVWILNNDTIVHYLSLRCICNRSNNEKIYSIVGSTLIFFYNNKKIQCVAGSTINKFTGKTSHIHENKNISIINNVDKLKIETQIDTINGASFFIPKIVIDKIGYFIDKFFMYYEDTEFCVRAKRKNVKLIWASDSFVFHKEGGTKVDNKYNWKNFITLRNRIAFMKIHYPFMTPIVCLTYIIMILKRIIRLKNIFFYSTILSIYHGLTFKK